MSDICLCCGKSVATIGMCVKCVNADCKAGFNVRCYCNGKRDVLGIEKTREQTKEVLKQTRYIGDSRTKSVSEIVNEVLQ